MSSCFPSISLSTLIFHYKSKASWRAAWTDDNVCMLLCDAQQVCLGSISVDRWMHGWVSCLCHSRCEVSCIIKNTFTFVEKQEEVNVFPSIKSHLSYIHFFNLYNGNPWHVLINMSPGFPWVFFLFLCKHHWDFFFK